MWEKKKRPQKVKSKQGPKYSSGFWVLSCGKRRKDHSRLKASKDPKYSSGVFFFSWLVTTACRVPAYHHNDKPQKRKFCYNFLSHPMSQTALALPPAAAARKNFMSSRKPQWQGMTTNLIIVGEVNSAARSKLHFLHVTFISHSRSFFSFCSWVRIMTISKCLPGQSSLIVYTHSWETWQWKYCWTSMACVFNFLGKGSFSYWKEHLVQRYGAGALSLSAHISASYFDMLAIIFSILILIPLILGQ